MAGMPTIIPMVICLRRVFSGEEQVRKILAATIS